MLDANKTIITYIEAFVGEKSLGKFVDMQSLNSYVKEHKIQDVRIKFETVKVKQNSEMLHRLVRNCHVR